jgi:hypothetical protein
VFFSVSVNYFFGKVSARYWSQALFILSRRTLLSAQVPIKDIKNMCYGKDHTDRVLREKITGNLLMLNLLLKIKNITGY